MSIQDKADWYDSMSKSKIQQAKIEKYICDKIAEAINLQETEVTIFSTFADDEDLVVNFVLPFDKDDSQKLLDAMQTI